jgi:hypothetical protein
VRPVAVTLAVAVVLAGTACGSQSHVQVRSAPRLPRALATSLAARSDALAGALRRGDGCAARIQVHGLERQTRLAIASGRVPAVYRVRLQSAVDNLAGRMPGCVPPPPPPPQPPPAPTKENDKQKAKKHGEGDKQGKHGKGPRKRGGGDEE